MATTRFDSSRGTPHGEIVQTTPASAISGEVRLIIDDGLSQDEVIIEIEKLKSRFLESDWPPA